MFFLPSFQFSLQTIECVVGVESGTNEKLMSWLYRKDHTLLTLLGFSEISILMENTRKEN